ncbi:MAG: TIGR00297 family protein, partial [Synechocystis sp.]
MQTTLTQLWQINQQFPWLMALIINSVLLAVALVIPKKLLTLWGYGHAWVLGVFI